MSERTVVQDPMLRYADAIGWDYVSAAEALRLRGGEAGSSHELLRERLLHLNPGIVDEARADWIIRQLTLLRADITGNRDALLGYAGEIGLCARGEPGAQRPPGGLQRPDQQPVPRHRRVDTAQSPLRQPGRRRLPDQWHPGRDLRDQEERGQAGRHRRRHHPGPPLPPGDAGDAPRAQYSEVTELLDFYYAATWSTSRKDLFNWKEERHCEERSVQ